jgi:hypothetical protein
MGRGRGTALLAAALLAIGAPAAQAAKKPGKKKKPTPSGKLATGTAAASSATTGVVSAVAVCPKGTKVVGGGYILQPHTSTNDFLNPLESRREGGRSWLVSAYRIDMAGAGPAMSLAAEAYCRSRPGKLTERVAPVTILGGANTGAPVATCPLGRAPASGGFSITPPATPNAFSFSLYDSLLAGSVGWVTRAVNLAVAPATTTFTSRVYCQAKGKKPPATVTGTGSVSNAGFVSASALTPACPGKRDSFAGGFSTPPFVGAPTGLVQITESRRAGRSWQVTGTRLSGGTDAAPVTAFGYCT